MRFFNQSYPTESCREEFVRLSGVPSVFDCLKSMYNDEEEIISTRVAVKVLAYMATHNDSACESLMVQQPCDILLKLALSSFKFSGDSVHTVH